MIVHKRFPWRALLHPTIDFGLNLPAPYIWFFYWLITWNDFNDPWSRFKFKNLKIKLLPD